MLKSYDRSDAVLISGGGQALIPLYFGVRRQVLERRSSIAGNGRRMRCVGVKILHLLGGTGLGRDGVWGAGVIAERTHARVQVSEEYVSE